MGEGMARGRFKNRFILRDSLLRFAFSQSDRRQIIACVGVVGTDLDRFLKMDLRLRWFAFGQEGVAEIIVGDGIDWFDFDCTLKENNAVFPIVQLMSGCEERWDENKARQYRC